MRPLLTLLLLAGCVALPACRSKPKKKAAELPIEPPAVELSAKRPTRRGGGASEVPKEKPEGAKPKTAVPAPAPAASRPKPPVEPKPAPVPQPVAAVPPAATNAPPKAKAANDPPRAAAPLTTPAKAPPATAPPTIPQPTVQRSASPPAPAPAKANRPPDPKGTLSLANPPTSSPKPAPAASKPEAFPPPSQPLPTTTRVTKPVGGRGPEINLAPKPPSTTPAAEPLRATIPSPAAAPARPAAVGPILGVVGMEARPRTGETRSLSLPPGGGGATNAVAPVPPLALQFGQGTNQPPATNAALRAIGVDPLLQGAAWREQQLAKQAAEQKAREEEQQKLKGALYRFLFKGGTNR